MSNILITSTWKNNFTLIKPFYKFYKEVWENQDMLFLIGMTSNIDDILEIIKNQLDIDIKLIQKNTYFQEDYLYFINNVYFFIYRTEEKMPANIWNNFRLKLYRCIFNSNLFNKYIYYLNTDNDDFFYIKNLSEYLIDIKNDKKDIQRFHTLEYLPNKNFDIDNDMNFINHTYYFITKSKKKLLNIDSKIKCKACRNIMLKNKYDNETHDNANNNKCLSNNCIFFNNNYDNGDNFNISIDSIDKVCFSFGCIDQNYLLNEKFWIQSFGPKKSWESLEKYKYSNNEIINEFEKSYTLTEEEKKTNSILTFNYLKKFFI